MNLPHVAVVMGGLSSEHEVSLKSGAMVAGSLDRARFRVTPVVITRTGEWKFPGEAVLSMGAGLTRLGEEQVDCVFLALHGPFGEDGRMQGLLDLLDIPYTGSGCAASALAMDKIRSKAVVRDAGLRVAKEAILHRHEWDASPDAVLERIRSTIGLPCVLKSPCQGSSLGMAIPRDETEFRHSLRQVLSFDDVVLIEEFLTGPEVTCGVLDVEPGAAPAALPVTEIKPVTADFFDYHAKYTPGATEEITPANLPDSVTKTIQERAVRVHTLMGCRTLSRSDFILVDNDPVWLEVNTIPGMTETSLYPQAAQAAGIGFSDLVGRFVDAAMARHNVCKAAVKDEK